MREPSLLRRRACILVTEPPHNRLGQFVR